MRTSVNLPDGLLEAARARARTEGRTVTSLVAEALRNLLAERESTRPRRSLTTDGHPEGRVLVDLNDKDALWVELDHTAPD